MAKMGRPRKEIDQKQFEGLCKLQCTLSEICGWFGITDKTLDSWCKRTYHQTFSEVFKSKREAGKISLRRAQFHLAESNASMAIWLGRQYLGQKDNISEMHGALEKLDQIIAGIDTAAKSDGKEK